MAVDLVVTDAGRAALVNAQNTGTAPVTITQVGLSATAVAATPAATALFGEFKRISGVPGEVVADDTIHINVTDDSADAYTVRSFGFYLADGTLFALYGQSSPIIEKASASIAALAFDTIFADIAAAELTFGNAEFTNPPATTDRQGVVELATVAEAQAGIDALRALTPAGAKAAVLGWLLAQDGAGSGLDADLLDGQHGSYYANIPARLGFTPVNKAGDTMGGFLSLHADPTAAMHAATRQWVLGQIATGALGFTPVNKAGDTMGGLLALSANPTANLHAAPKQYVDGLVTAAALLAKILTVDGAGSGLDADLLDGKDSAWFENIAARLGFTPVNKAGDTMTGLLTLSGNPTNNLHAVTKQYADALLPAATILSRLLTVDGSGSGLDADLLDGRHASEFQLASDGTKFGSNSYGYWEERANGFCEQWGTITGTFSQGNYSHTFPRPFGDAASVNIQLTPYNPVGGTTQTYDWWPQRGVTNGTIFSWTVQDSSAVGVGQGVDWRAIGKL